MGASTSAALHGMRSPSLPQHGAAMRAPSRGAGFRQTEKCSAVPGKISKAKEVGNLSTLWSIFHNIWKEDGQFIESTL